MDYYKTGNDAHKRFSQQTTHCQRCFKKSSEAVCYNSFPIIHTGLRDSLTYQHHFQFYTRNGLWTLFLVTALPIHVWTIILVLDDFSWVADRTNTWDAIGEAAYGLVYALLESLIVLLIIALLGFLLPRRLPEDKRIAVLGVGYLATALWAIFAQRNLIPRIALSPTIARLLVSSGHPLWILYGTALLLIGITVVLPTALTYFSEGLTSAVKKVIDRLSLLTTFYLFFDLVALIVLVGRNL